MPIIVDASVSLGWVLRDEATPYVDMILDRVREDQGLVAPHWPMEVGNGLLVAARRGRISPADITHAVSLLCELPISEYPLPLDTVLERVRDLAISQGLTVYDAAYLDIAMVEGLPLATQDQELRAAAPRVGVALL